MNRLFTILFLFLFTSCLHCQKEPVVLISTKYGEIKIKLYEDTPLHTSNFLKLAEIGFFDEQLFHRVIPNFMIQSGDPYSRNAPSGKPLGNGGPGYTIPPEFIPQYYHKKGAIAAARQSDDINPDKESSGSQFYIVQGRVYSRPELDVFVSRGLHIPFTREQINTYTTIGGTPHLDYSYTVFGEVIEGIDVVDKIAAVATDKRNRPSEDIQITVKVLNK